MAPAFPYALSMILGMGFAFLNRPWILLPAILLLLWQEKSRAPQLIIVGLAACLFAQTKIPPQTTSQIGYFKPQLMRAGQSHFGMYTLLLGKLTTLEGTTPCSIFLPYRKKHPPQNCHYIVEGKLKTPSRFYSSMQLKNWTPVPNTFTLTEKRYQTKKAVRAYLRKKIKDKEAFSLIAALATGELMDNSLAFDFGRLGLLHLLAISGFHFSLLALFLSKIVSKGFPKKIAGIILLILLSLFYLYMGPTASVTRAGLTILLPMLGTHFGLKMPALNALSLAAIFALLTNPLSLTNLGFQLSYLATFGIITLYPKIRHLLSHLLPIRTKTQALQLSTLDQHGYLLVIFFRSALSLTTAVTLTTLPLILLTFGKFPLLSLIYNFFFPLGMALLLFFLLTSFLFPPLFFLTESTAKILLIFTHYPPKRLDFSLHAPFITLEIVIILLTILAHSATAASYRKAKS
ncbi:MAG: hypothetical protein ChlgKO_03800 [Chlamydiales bacterium]